MGSGVMARGKAGNIGNIGKAGNIGNIGKAGNIAGEENNAKQVAFGNQRPKSVVKTPEKKRLKFHNVFFDKVMEMKEVQVNKETPKKSCRSKKRKATNELIIKEYNPTIRRNEPPWRKEKCVKEEGLKGNMTTAEHENKDRKPTLTPHNLHLDVQAATATGPLDLRTRVREATPESGNSIFDSPGSSMHSNSLSGSPGSSMQSSPESTPSSAMRLGSPPPLEPLPTQMTPIKCNSSKAASRPFAEGFMWHLLSQLRQEAPKARKEGKATVPSG